jgi:hypothetical protein
MEVFMEEEHTDMYSSPYENYIRLVRTIQTLESENVRLTEDWYEEHKQHILTYRETFPNFHTINEEVQSDEFRKKAHETEIILSNLVHEVQTRNLFNLKMYLLLNKHLKQLCEIVWGEDELSEMLGRMGL